MKQFAQEKTYLFAWLIVAVIVVFVSSLLAWVFEPSGTRNFLDYIGNALQIAVFPTLIGLYRQMKGDHGDNRDAIALLQGEYGSLQQKMEAVVAENTELVHANTKLEEEKAILGQENEQLRSDLREATAELATARRDIESLEQRILALQKALQEVEKRLTKPDAPTPKKRSPKAQQ